MRYYLSFSKKQNEVGQGLVEYGLILVLVSVVCIVILSAMGSGVADVFCKVTSALGGGASSVTVTGNSGSFTLHQVDLEAGQTITVSATTGNNYIVGLNLRSNGGSGPDVATSYTGNSDGQASLTYTVETAGTYGILVQTASSPGTGAPSDYTLTYSTC